MVDLTGKRNFKSPINSGLTVNEVGHVQCARPEGADANESAVGTSVSSFIVTGFIAEYLSRQAKSNEIRQGLDVPKSGLFFATAVRDRVKSLAYPKESGSDDIAAWNGMFPPGYTGPRTPWQPPSGPPKNPPSRKKNPPHLSHLAVTCGLLTIHGGGWSPQQTESPRRIQSQKDSIPR